MQRGNIVAVFGTAEGGYLSLSDNIGHIVLVDLVVSVVFYIVSLIYYWILTLETLTIRNCLFTSFSLVF